MITAFIKLLNISVATSLVSSGGNTASHHPEKCTEMAPLYPMGTCGGETHLPDFQ